MQQNRQDNGYRLSVASVMKNVFSYLRNKESDMSSRSAAASRPFHTTGPLSCGHHSLSSCVEQKVVRIRQSEGDTDRRVMTLGSSMSTGKTEPYRADTCTPTRPSWKEYAAVLVANAVDAVSVSRVEIFWSQWWDEQRRYGWLAASEATDHWCLWRHCYSSQFDCWWKHALMLTSNNTHYSHYLWKHHMDQHQPSVMVHALLQTVALAAAAGAKERFSVSVASTSRHRTSTSLTTAVAAD